MNVRSIALTGEYDLASEPELRHRLLEAENCDVAVIDMSGVTYLDSTSLRCLIRLKNAMLANGHAGVVRIVDPSPNVARIFRICSMDKLFSITERA